MSKTGKAGQIACQTYLQKQHGGGMSRRRADLEAARVR
jgi:hypothetical protein